MKEIFDVLPDKINSCLKDKSNLNKLQEIRVKVGKPLNIVLDNTETIFNYVIRREDVKAIIQKISNYSLYAFEEDIRQGYITIQGGHRVGLAGQCVIEDNSIKTIRNITSLNIRVCREIVGCSNSLMNSLVENNRVAIILTPELYAIINPSISLYVPISSHIITSGESPLTAIIIPSLFIQLSYTSVLIPTFIWGIPL